MNLVEKFLYEKAQNIERLGNALPAQRLAFDFLMETAPYKYSYNFNWLGRPIIQYPQDIMAMQEIIWETKPDLIIETGIAHGGSLIFYASMIALLELSGCITKGKVLGIDIDIREHNRIEIQKHPMYSHIEMIQGSSTDPSIVHKVHEFAKDYKKILLCLDSMHSHNHVFSELKSYAPLVFVDSYCVVFDTVIEDMPSGSFPDRPWDKGNNPKTAVLEFLREIQDSKIQDARGQKMKFEIDKNINNKILISVAPSGYLKRVPA